MHIKTFENQAARNLLGSDECHPIYSKHVSLIFSCIKFLRGKYVSNEHIHSYCTCSQIA